MSFTNGQIVIPRGGKGKKMPRRGGGLKKMKVIDATTDQPTAMANPSVVLTTNMLVESVQSAAMAIVTWMMERGYTTTVPAPDYCYWTYVYICVLLQLSAQDSVPQSVVVPEWLKMIMDMLLPTQTKKAFGGIAYNWNIVYNAAAVPYTFDLLPSGASRVWNVGNVTTNEINGMFKTVGPAAAYTPENGITAWSCALEFMAKMKTDGITIGLNKLVNMSHKTKYATDPSSFASRSIQMGSNSSMNGGVGELVWNEVPIPTPMAACFTALPTGLDEDPSRMPNYARYTCADPALLAGLLLAYQDHKVADTKRPVMIKPIDFWELTDTVGQWMNQIGNQLSTDENSKMLLSGVPDPNPSLFQLGITFQEFWIMLRYMVTRLNQKTQFAVQTVQPSNLFANPKAFMPLVVGQGTYAVDADMPLLPQPLVENLRCLTSRIVEGGRGADMEIWAAQWGVFTGYKLDPTQYYYTVGEAKYQYFLTPVNHIVKDMKPGDTITDMKVRSNVQKLHPGVRISWTVEEEISVINGSTGSDFVAINGVYGLNKIISIWNKWAQSIGWATDTLTNIAVDAGPGGLQVLDKTRIIWINSKDTDEHPNKTIPPGHTYQKKTVLERFIRDDPPLDQWVRMSILIPFRRYKRSRHSPQYSNIHMSW